MRALRLTLLMFGTVFSLAVMSSAAFANTYDVDTTNWTADADAGNGICADSGGDCSLRAAIQESNADGTTSTITFSVTGTITYNADIDNISAPVTVTGPGAGNLTINCGTATNKNAFSFSSGSDGSTISGGITVAGCTGSGKGIVGMRDDTTISDITMSGDGEIKVDNSVDVDNVTISDNTLRGYGDNCPSAGRY